MTFAVAAEAYDRYMGRYSALLAPQLIELAEVTPGQVALDVGCGPGALTGKLVELLGPDAVAAVDPSESFVAAARERHPGVDVQQGSAEQLPFADSTFDMALAALVVHFMSDPVTGLREMARVTKPGGVVAACVWDFGGGHGPLGPFWQAAGELDPDVVDESELPGTREGQLAELFGTAGLRDLREETHRAPLEVGNFDEWWEPFLLGVGPGGAYATGLDDRARDALRERCRELLPPVPFTLDARAWAVRGVA